MSDKEKSKSKKRTIVYGKGTVARDPLASFLLASEQPHENEQRKLVLDRRQQRRDKQK